MEYLVTMTTHVPTGTPEKSVDEVRNGEAERARELAAQGFLLRLWRPPLEPGEWRTLGLFAAEGDGELEQVLSSMPLRVWRTDEVTPLSPHPHDPGISDHSIERTPRAGTREFLTTFDDTVPATTTRQAVEQSMAHEGRRAGELAEEGHLRRLWALPAEPEEVKTLGLWRARDMFEMQKIIESLPMELWLNTRTMPLTEHPSDPAIDDG
jgi:muconolactone delta-isomerase